MENFFTWFNLIFKLNQYKKEIDAKVEALEARIETLEA